MIFIPREHLAMSGDIFGDIEVWTQGLILLGKRWAYFQPGDILAVSTG
jgi:hypothetical protein